VAALFPSCGLGDAQRVHDFMSYGVGGTVPIYGGGRWVSDINYYRIHRFFEDCIALDPPHRFAGPGPAAAPFADPSGGCTPARGAGVVMAAASSEAGAFAAAPSSRSIDALVITGVLTAERRIDDVRVIRKPVPEHLLGRQDGPYALIASDRSGRTIDTVRFRALKVGLFHPPPDRRPVVKPQDTFIAILPYAEKIARLEIRLGQASLFRRTASRTAPKIDLQAPRGGEHWAAGKQRITWKASDPDGDSLDAVVLLSQDAGLSWQPVALVDSKDGVLEVDVADLPSTSTALIYVAVSDGLNTAVARSSSLFAIGDRQAPRPR
jgi:hypothetical protein